MTLIIVFSPDVAVAALAMPGTGGNNVLHREHDQLHTGFFIGFHKIISFLSPLAPPVGRGLAPAVGGAERSEAGGCGWFAILPSFA